MSNPAKLDESLSTVERGLIADHHNHRELVARCRSCFEQLEVNCPTCNNQVLPWTLAETEVFSTHQYGVRVRAIATACKRCSKKPRKRGLKSA